MRTVERERTAYPHLWRDITEQEVISRYTLSEEELKWVQHYRGNQLSLALRLKLFEHLLSHSLPFSEVPEKVLDYVASQLQVLPQMLSENKDSKYEQIQLIRKYTAFSPFTLKEADKLQAWLIVEAEKQFHLVDLVNATIFHLLEISVELPAFGSLVRLAAQASYEADRKQRELLLSSISNKQKEKLDVLLTSECRYQRTPFYELKEPPANPNAKTIQKEIQLLQRLRSFNLDFDALKQINNDKIKHFFEVAKSYSSNELHDLNPQIRYPILLCFIYMRIKEVTDNIIELLIRLWNKITKEVENAQDEYILKKDSVKQESESLSEQLLEIIVESTSKDEIVDRIFDLHTYEEYKSLLAMIRRFKRPKKEKYFEALSNRYSFIRRFTPLIWENLTFSSNTSDDTLIRAIEYLKENLQPTIPELPVTGALTDFVPDDWDRAYGLYSYEKRR